MNLLDKVPFYIYGGAAIFCYGASSLIINEERPYVSSCLKILAVFLLWKVLQAKEPSQFILADSFRVSAYLLKDYERSPSYEFKVQLPLGGIRSISNLPLPNEKLRFIGGRVSKLSLSAVDLKVFPQPKFLSAKTST